MQDCRQCFYDRFCKFQENTERYNYDCDCFRDKKAIIQTDKLVDKAKSELVNRYKKYKKFSDKQKDIDMHWFYQGRAEACWEAIVVLEYLTGIRKEVCPISEWIKQIR